MNKLFTLILLVLVSTGYSQQETKKITLEDIYKARKFSSKGVYGIRSMKDGTHYCQLKKDSLNVYDYETGSFTRCVVTSGDLVPDGDTVPIDMGSFDFSDDESRILFAVDEEPIYRRSSKAYYYIYDIKSSKLVPLADRKDGKQRLATFSPDGRSVAFVRDNNLFVANVDSLIAHRTSHIALQLTSDGKPNFVINGATDWVYEEEFEFSRAFFWSPDSKKIAWYRFDETHVKEYELTYYGDLYPEHYKFKYPKAGENNSLVSIHIRDLASLPDRQAGGISKTIDTGKDTDIYIPRIKWTEDPNTLALYRMNRHQNRLELLLADASTGATHVIYTEENKQYIEINDHWHFLKNGKEFLLSSEKDGYRHIYLYGMDGKLIRQLTSGNWEVTDIQGIDEEKGRVFYTAQRSSPMNQDLYMVTLDGKRNEKISGGEGSISADFSTGCRYFISRRSDINTPFYITVNREEGKEVRVLQDNAKLRATMKEYGFSKAEFFSFKTGEGIELNGWMLKPPDFDPGKKYPVMFTIYGGPGSQTVKNSWGTVSSWNQYWAQNGIIVVSVDNRGTGGRGEEFKKCTYLQLGKYETIDQVEAAKYLGSLSYVDKDRIGMWGWSFGGYLTLSCLTLGADYFKLGVAVAPVSNWKYYDNIYTERFMRTPAENEEGYESNSPVNHAGKLKGRLLIIHGMADDNVHPQNTYDFITALVAANKQFEMQLYPNSNHGIYTGKNTMFHLYSRMTEFILSGL